MQSTPAAAFAAVSATAPATPAATHASLESALSRLGDYAIACCVSFPSDEELHQRLQSRCAALESGLPPADRGRWRAERDGLLVRLGCQPWY